MTTTPAFDPCLPQTSSPATLPTSRTFDHAISFTSNAFWCAQANSSAFRCQLKYYCWPQTLHWLQSEGKPSCYSLSLFSLHFLPNISYTHVFLFSPGYYRHAHFTMLCRYCFFYKWKVCGNSSSSKSKDSIFPIAFAHCVSLCHILAILQIF